jgi:aminopeptidase-like protein
MAFLWVLNLSDGAHSLLQIAERSGLPFSTIKRAAEELEGQGLLRRAAEGIERTCADGNKESQ